MLLYLILLFIATPTLFLIANEVAKKCPKITRKLLHSGLFLIGAVIYVYYGVQLVTLYGLYLFPFSPFLTSDKTSIGKAILRGERQRETFIGLGLTVSASFINATLFPQYFLYGVLIAAIGDTCGDLVGSTVGKIKYNVPLTDLAIKFLQIHAPKIYKIINPTEKKHSRSVEGSVALMISSALTLLPLVPPEEAITCAFAAALLEAISPRNTDNFILQITPSIVMPFF